MTKTVAPSEPSHQRGDAAFEMAHAGTLSLFPDLVHELGGDAERLMCACGIDLRIPEQTMPRISLRALIAVMDRAAQVLQCPDFGLRLARRQRGGRVFGPLGVVMRNCATLGEALRYVAANNQAYSLAAAIPLEEERQRRLWFVGFDILLPDPPVARQLVEQVMLLAHLNAVDTSEGRARAREIRFRHQPLAPLRTYRDAFGCDVLFGQSRDGICLSGADLDAPLRAPVGEYRELAECFIENNYPPRKPPMHARVRALVRRTIGADMVGNGGATETAGKRLGDCQVEAVAEVLCVHPRTLHRRLKDEGTTFEAIKDEVRRSEALYCLEQTTLPVTAIAERLGYAETSVLSRSCLRWFGAAPRDVRARASSGR